MTITVSGRITVREILGLRVKTRASRLYMSTILSESGIVETTGNLSRALPIIRALISTIYIYIYIYKMNTYLYYIAVANPDCFG